MLAWQVPYLGWRHFPAELSELEISRFFTFEPEVHRAIRSRYKDTLRLGIALQLGFLTMCGRTLHAFQRVPAELLKLRLDRADWLRHDHVEAQISGLDACRDFFIAPHDS